ncbi:protein-glucosylgalactosylhydroxylysine glucosidase-like [Ochlerotatus camptorhynchus]|uniref:protein-glucosylgalactosylhydroxylysine glucosidase-like n=1 Tax=Ochlerotatus camptorhynchus TaxID=644619 RepID=UPI0031E1926D
MTNPIASVIIDRFSDILSHFKSTKFISLKVEYPIGSAQFSSQAPRQNSFPEASAVPTLSNGNLGFTVFSDSVFLTGVYNRGEFTGLGPETHRARIPNYANFQLTRCSRPETNPPDCSYQLDIKTGRFRTVYEDTDQQYRLIHSVYPHRYFNHAIVNHFRIQRLNGRGVIQATILRIMGVPSPDIRFEPAQRVLIRGQTFLYQCGWTHEVEDPELQVTRTEVCFYYQDYPTMFELPTDRTSEEFSYFTVYANSRAEAEGELNFITMSSVQNIEQAQTNFMNGMWDKYGITVDGNDELDRAIKVSAFQLFSNVPNMFTPIRVKTFGISPSGIGRNDFLGHVMWDFDMWMFPIIQLLDPLVAREMLDYRTKTIRRALAGNAAMNQYEGWQYPWASAATGREVTTSPEAAELMHHITADVTFVIRQYLYATDDYSWLHDVENCELLYESARFWKNRTVYNPSTDKFDIPSVTGPDQMNPNVTNNVFTNVAAAHNLFLGEFGGCMCSDLWRRDLNLKDLVRVAKSLHLLYDELDDFNPQFEGFIKGQQTGQADAVLLGYPLDIPMTDSTKRRNLEIYGSTTVENTPPMTWSMHTIGWLELNDLTRAAEYLHRSYQPYLRAPFYVWNQSPTGSPGASNYVSGAASFLHTIINGYGGIRLRNEELVLDRPRLPPGTTRLYIPQINFNRYSFALEVRQDGRFSILQHAMPTAPQLRIIADGQEYKPCGPGQSCVVHGSHNASLKLVRNFQPRCTLKPTTLNMKLADQNGGGVVARISPMIFVTVLVAAMLNKLF